jgi:hypothetical protein
MKIKKFNEAEKAWAEKIGNHPNPNQKVIMQWSTNWADEMYIEGFVITNKIESDRWLERISNIRNRFKIYVGTNEDIDYRNGNELIREVTITEISENEANTIIKFFGSSSGHTSFLGANL